MKEKSKKQNTFAENRRYREEGMHSSYLSDENRNKDFCKLRTMDNTSMDSININGNVNYKMN